MEVRYFADTFLTQQPREASLKALLEFIRKKGSEGASLAEIEAHFEDYVEGEKEKQTAFRQKIADQKERLVQKLVERGYVSPGLRYQIFLRKESFEWSAIHRVHKALESFCESVAFDGRSSTFTVTIKGSDVDRIFEVPEVDKIAQL